MKLNKENIIKPSSSLSKGSLSETNDLSESTSQDPRIKSPDDLLKMRAPNKDVLSKAPKPEEKPVEQPKVRRNGSDEKFPARDSAREEFGIPDLSKLKNELESERRQMQEAKKELPFQIENYHVHSDDSNALIQADLGTHAPTDEKPRPTSPALSRAEHLTNIEAEVEMAELKARYTKEISQWKEYAQNVKHWQAQVLDIVQNLKKEVNKSRQEQNELKALREAVRQKDEELRRHQAQSKNKLVSWMKNLAKAPTPAKLPQKNPAQTRHFTR